MPAANVHKFFGLTKMDFLRLEIPVGVMEQRKDPIFPNDPKY
jgi:hypothetical protein